jgi:pimeloyl-ACP methyl ester carboxylesterase
MSQKESFVYQTEYLSKFYRVIAPDLTGFGSSPKMTFPYAVDDYVNDVIRLIDQLSINSYHIIAHSFGGRITAKLLQKDSRCKKVILTGSAGLKPRRKPSYYIKVYLYKFLKKFVSEKRLSGFGSREYKALSSLEKQSYVKVVSENLYDYYSKITNQTLIIFGESDLETPLYMAETLNKIIKNSTLWIIKGAGHFCFIDKPAEFNLIVKEFLAGE